jgi:hypothetical protein
MKRIITAAAAMAMISLISPVLSSASPQSDTASSANSAANSDSGAKPMSRRMKACIAQQKATNSSSMSESAMETVCKNQLKKQQALKNGNDLSTGPQNETSSSPQSESPPH